MRYAFYGPALVSPVRPFDTGERRLMLATLEDAIRTVLGARHGRTHPRSAQQDLEWIVSDDQSQPFAYARICDALGIDSDWLRARVLAASGRSPREAPRPPAARIAGDYEIAIGAPGGTR